MHQVERAAEMHQVEMAAAVAILEDSDLSLLNKRKTAKMAFETLVEEAGIETDSQYSKTQATFQGLEFSTVALINILTKIPVEDRL